MQLVSQILEEHTYENVMSCVNGKNEELNFSHLLRNQGTDGISGFLFLPVTMGVC